MLLMSVNTFGNLWKEKNPSLLRMNYKERLKEMLFDWILQ